MWNVNVIQGSWQTLTFLTELVSKHMKTVMPSLPYP